MIDDAEKELAGESPDDTVDIPAPTTDHPTSIGAFTLVRLIAHGTLTRLYEAQYSTSSDLRFVAKILRGDSQETRKWFASVASAMNALDHPNILRCESFDSTDEYSYIVTPLVDGNDLWETVRKNGPLESTRLIQIVSDTARALDYAHSCGVIHGNLHPKHVLLDHDGSVSLIGFAEFGPSRHYKMRFGNPHHLAPEQIESDLTLPASDIYAITEVSYLCLCGSFAFAGHNSTQDMFKRKRSGPIPSIKERRPDSSKRVDAILQRGMAIRPEERYSSAGEFASAFSAAIESMTKRKWWRIW